MVGLAETTFLVVLIGVGATAVMDLWLLILKRLHVPTLNFAFIGRWVGHIFQGKWFHEGMLRVEPIKGELRIGWLTHYAIGVAFAALLVSVFGVGWMDNPTFLPAISVGMATVIAPLFIMQPAMDAGIASSKTASPTLFAYHYAR